MTENNVKIFFLMERDKIYRLRKIDLKDRQQRSCKYIGF